MESILSLDQRVSLVAARDAINWREAELGSIPGSFVGGDS